MLWPVLSARSQRPVSWPVPVACAERAFCGQFRGQFLLPLLSARALVPVLLPVLSARTAAVACEEPRAAASPVACAERALCGQFRGQFLLPMLSARAGASAMACDERARFGQFRGLFL